MPLIDDHAAIARRMRELKAERDSRVFVKATVDFMIECAREAKRQRAGDVTVIVHSHPPKTSSELREIIARMRAVKPRWAT